MTRKFAQAQYDLGNKIKILRLKDKISQEDLAYKASIERSYMGKIERGEGNPSFKKIVDIANALGITPAELIS
jgi:transcriptional regulator with XRE-family HTH domain